MLGVGIIGTGWVAGEHIRAFEADSRTQVLALCGRSQESAKTKAAECGLDCETYDDYRAMLERDDISIVSIASPPNVHREHAVAAAEAGKHIMLEKPMATTLDDCRAIRDAVADAGVKSVVSFVLRWNPLLNIIKTQLNDNAVGKVFYGEVDYFHGIGPWYKQYEWNVKKEMGASSLLSAGCHALDALRWFMPGEIAEVTQYACPHRGPDFAEYEYDPTTVTILKFSDGRVGKVTSCIAVNQPYVFDIHLLGERGAIRNNQIYSEDKFPGQTSWAEVPTIMPDSGDVTHHPFMAEASHLIHCVANDMSPLVDVADAYETHEIAFAADRSGETGRPVKLPLT